jgi:hypothetical protein
MAQYTVTTKQKQEKGLDFVLARANTYLAEQTPPTSLTRDEFVQEVFDTEATKWVAERKDKDRSTVGERYSEATDEQRAQVDAILV